MSRFLLTLWLVFAGIGVHAAQAQTLSVDAADVQNPTAFVSEEEQSVRELRSAFEQSDGNDLEVLRTTLSARREQISTFIDQLTDEQANLEALLAQTETGVAGEGQGLSEGEREQRVARLAVLTDVIDKAEIVRRDYDGLAAQMAEAGTRATLQTAVDERRAEIEAASRRLNETEDETGLVALREELRALRAAAAEDVAPLEISRDRLAADLDRLGPAPGEGDVAEAPEIAEEREKLRSALVVEDAIVRQSALNITDINRLLADITKKRRDQFYSQVFSRGPSPLNISLAGAASRDASEGSADFVESISRWQAAKAEQGGLGRAYGHIAISLIIGFILFVPARRWANQRILKGLQKLEPTPGRRAWAALLRIFARAIPGVVAGFLVLAALAAQGAIDENTRPLARAIWFGLLALVTAEAAAAAVLSPGVPGWRLMPLEKRCGQSVKFLFLTLVFLFFADRILSAGAATFVGGQELALMQSAVIACLMGAIFILLSRKRLWILDDHRRDDFSDEAKALGKALRNGALILGGLIVAATLYGYVALGYYVATRTFMVGGLLVLGLFIRLFLQEALRTLDQAMSGRKTKPEDETESERFIFFWIGAFVDVLIILALLPLVAIAFGAEWVDVRDAVASAFFGFKIGNVTFSLAQFLGAVATFVAILALTRFIQRTGEKRFFPRTRLDTGVQNSLKTLIGYVGLVIAIMASIGVLGFNLSSLAIIAGALSVGIGFGLQSIVNNFVSGLILLFERPIKVGDWIVVSSGEGTVKRISVRSTEIETWDRSSIIVPNSELISSSVTNWTHKDRWTRLIMPIGVSYDSDPRKVIEVLEGVIKENKKIMRYPEPFIYFVGFGDSSLDFEVRVFMRETSERLPTLNELRIAAFEAFRDAGIEIPFPQRDLHVRSAPGFPTSGEAADAPLAAQEPTESEPQRGEGPAAKAAE